MEMDITTKRMKLIDRYPDKAREYAQKLHKKKEDIEFVQKYYYSDKSESIEKEKAIVSLITTTTKDRDGEVLLPEGMVKENYEKSGRPVFWGHSYRDPFDVIGQNAWFKPDPNGKGIIAKTNFRNTEFADEVYRLFTEDLVGQGPVLKGWSVGFIPLDWDEGGEDKEAPRRTYKKWELLEYSAVPIGSNPDALTMAYQKGFITSERLKKDLPIPEVQHFQENADQSLVEDVQNEEDLNIEQNVGVVTKPETTENYHRIPVSEGHDGHEIKTIDIDKDRGIKALYCVTCKEIKTYLFPTDKFTMEEAQSWVNAHKEGIILVPSETEEGQTGKDIDTLKDWIKGLQADVTVLKEGRILSTQNRKLINDCIGQMRDAIEVLQKLHDATDPASREEEKSSIESTTELTTKKVDISKDEIKNIVMDHLKGMNIGKAMADAADLAIKKLRGKVE